MPVKGALWRLQGSRDYQVHSKQGEQHVVRQREPEASSGALGWPGVLGKSRPVSDLSFSSTKRTKHGWEGPANHTEGQVQQHRLGPTSSPRPHLTLP
ncbi:uncharacterized protein RBU33_024712 isoform 2-T2 [Hipposideros larvatus]